MALPPLSSLGWQGRARYDDPDVAALRATLAAEGGLPNIAASAVHPSELGYARHAAAIFKRDGFVVVRDVLDAERLATIRAGMDTVIRGMMALDEGRTGNRGSHRYSFGSANAHFGCQKEWAALIDPPPLTPVLEAIFGTLDYHCATAASGGDFVLPGALGYQNLHSDGTPPGDPMRDVPIGTADTFGLGLCVIYPMEVVHDPDHTVGHTPWNGATRQIRATQTSHDKVPSLDEESRASLLSTLAPTNAGDAVVRDNRSWHGGTPNLGQHIRAIPDVKFCGPLGAPKELGGQGGLPGFFDFQRTLPYEIWEEMTPHGQHITRGIVAKPGETIAVDFDELRVGRGGVEPEPLATLPPPVQRL
jgi:hypothetical protein